MKQDVSCLPTLTRDDIGILLLKRYIESSFVITIKCIADPLPFPILEHVQLKPSTSKQNEQLVLPLQTTAQPTG